MSEFIRKESVLELLNELELNHIDYNAYNELWNCIEALPPEEVVEMPCNVGDTVVAYNTAANALFTYTITEAIIEPTDDGYSVHYRAATHADGDVIYTFTFTDADADVGIGKKVVKDCRGA